MSRAYIEELTFCALVEREWTGKPITAESIEAIHQRMMRMPTRNYETLRPDRKTLYPPAPAPSA